MRNLRRGSNFLQRVIEIGLGENVSGGNNGAKQQYVSGRRRLQQADGQGFEIGFLSRDIVQRCDKSSVGKTNHFASWCELRPNFALK